MGGNIFWSGLIWRDVNEELPELPDGGIEASADVFGAVIRNGEIKKFDRICRCSVDDYDGNPVWTRDGRLISWIPTHWLPVDKFPFS